MDIEQILRALPHRYPFILVDRILEVEGTTRVVGLKNVTINEPFFQGHFPGHPIMPGVLIVEAMAQVGGCLMLGAMEHPEQKLVYFMGVDGVRFRRPVRPGDQLRMEVTVLQVRGGTCRMKGVATVDGKTVAEGEMLAQIVDREGSRGAAG
jgi:beta-hydroxyacyl-ACP dehydratase FabZ